MTAKRKTIDVQRLKELLNLRISVAQTLEERKNLSYFLSDILMETGNYREFKNRTKLKYGFWEQHTDGTQTWIAGDPDDYQHEYY